MVEDSALFLDTHSISLYFLKLPQLSLSENPTHCSLLIRRQYGHFLCFSSRGPTSRAATWTPTSI